MKKGLLLVIMLITALSSVTHAYRDQETGTFLTRDPIGYTDGPNLYCYVHCNPITSFDAWGLETIEQYQSQIDEVDQQYRAEYESHRSEHWDSNKAKNEGNGWDSQENADKGTKILTNWRQAKAPLQSARDAIISSTKAFNEAFGKEIAAGKMNSLNPLKVDDDFINPSALSDLAFDKNVEKICLNTIKNVVKYTVIANALLSITGTSEAPAGVPKGWNQRPSKKGGGTEYYNPANPKESIRVMPGNSNSPYKNSQSKYVVHRGSGDSYLDVDGNAVPRQSSESHIPIDKWQEANQ